MTKENNTSPDPEKELNAQYIGKKIDLGVKKTTNFIGKNQKKVLGIFVATLAATFIFANGEKVFSLNRNNFAFVAEKDDKYFIVKDGEKIGKEYDYLDSPVFSPDGKSFAFSAREGDKTFIVKDGEEIGKEYDDVSSPVFSPN